MAGYFKRAALQFVILLGLVSLFADMTYEVARSIMGPYLAVLGASACITAALQYQAEARTRIFGRGFSLYNGLANRRSDL
jgi:hypothetical protein